MCGLLAIIARGRDAEPELLRRGLSGLAHRGPDAQDMTIERVAGAPGGSDVCVALAHTRLSIIDLDPRSNQPFADGDHVLAYNGELYDFRELRDAMRRDGERFRTEGDAEVFLRLLARDGVDGLRKGNGMWAFCWHDRRRRRLTAGRDRYGKKPLFYVMDEERVCFASEIGPLLSIAGRKPVARDGTIASFLAEGWLFPRTDGGTHIAGVHEVRPGCCIEFDLDRWTLIERSLNAFDAPAQDDAAPTDLAALLCDAVEKRLVSDRKVGLMLSGGVDSSLILSILAARGRLDGVVCITGDAGKSEDARYARECLDIVGRPAIEATLDYGDAGFDRFLTTCAHQEKPFPLIGNVLGMSALYRAAGAEGVRVVLDGTGADEIFGGYWTRYAGFAMRDAARAGDAAWLTRLRNGGLLPRELADAPTEALVGPTLPSPVRETLRADDVALLRPDVREAIAATPSCDPLLDITGDLSQALSLDARAGRMQEWLWQNDRNAMAASVENRSPFLDHRLARFMATPYHAKFDGKWNKRELRRLFDDFTPLPTAQRADKQGFRWVYGRFVRNNRARVKELLAASHLVRRYLDLERIPQEEGCDPYVDTRLLPRALVIAGLEAVGSLS